MVEETFILALSPPGSEYQDIKDASILSSRTRRPQGEGFPGQCQRPGGGGSGEDNRE